MHTKSVFCSSSDTASTSALPAPSFPASSTTAGSGLKAAALLFFFFFPLFFLPAIGAGDAVPIAGEVSACNPLTYGSERRSESTAANTSDSTLTYLGQLLIGWNRAAHRQKTWLNSQLDNGE